MPESQDASSLACARCGVNKKIKTKERKKENELEYRKENEFLKQIKAFT